MKPNLKLKFAPSIISAKRAGWYLRLQKTFVSLLMLLFICCFGCKKINPVAENAPNVTKTDPQLSTSSVTGDEFTIVELPDTQYYVRTTIQNPTDGELAMFTAQTQWIVDHKTSENIVYVAHLGDMVDWGDTNQDQWVKDSTAMHKLDVANIPYGPCVGNHDMTPNGIDAGGIGGPLHSTTNFYNQYFGISHFTGKPWYGGHYSNDNNNHYDLFTAGGLDFIVIYVMYDQNNDQWIAIDSWVNGLLNTYSNRKAILVTHYVGTPATPSAFSEQTQNLYDNIKSKPNLFMFLGGHVLGEGYRQDTYNGKTIRSFISDYQGRPGGGNGYMRIMKISVANDRVDVKTYSPFLNQYETDSDSQFSVPLFHNQNASRTCDFSNDGKTDLAFFNNGVWKVNGMSNYTNGTTGDIPTPADYNGNGQADYCVYRPSNQTWYSNGIFAPTQYGLSGDIPVPADYNGDGKAEFALFRPSTAKWYINPSATGTTYGNPGDIPVPGDYDGDGKVDLAVWRPTSPFHWYMYGLTGADYGTTGDIPVPGDYDGDGITDIAVFRPSTGVWYLHNISSTIVCVAHAAGDIPAPGDYDGKGKTQPAVYRPSTHTLYIYHWATSTITTVNYAAAASGDKLLNLPYNIRNFFFP